MSEICVNKMVLVNVQENGIVRGTDGYIIARLEKDISYDSKHLKESDHQTAIDQKDKEIEELLEYKKTAEELANDFIDADMERNRLRDALVEITLVIGEVKDRDSVQDMLHRKCKKYQAIAHKALKGINHENLDQHKI